MKLEAALRRSIQDGLLPPQELDHDQGSCTNNPFPTPPTLEKTHRISLFSNSFLPYTPESSSTTAWSTSSSSSHVTSANAGASSALRRAPDSAKHQIQQPRRGYFLPDFTSDEEEEEDDEDQYNASSDDEQGQEGRLGRAVTKSKTNDKEIEEEDDTPLDWNSSFNLLTLDPRSPAFHVASLASRRGPWDVREEKERSMAKKHISSVVDKLYEEVKTLQQTPTNNKYNIPTHIKESDQQGQQLARQALQQANALKEKRIKESKELNDAMFKDIESCLAILEHERQEAQRIREEAIRKEREERERLVREAEEKKKALEAKKKADEQRIAEAKKKQEEQAKEAARKKAEQAAQAVANVESMYASTAAKEEYERYWSLFEKYRFNIKPNIANNKPLRKMVNEIKRDVTPAIGQVVNTLGEINTCYSLLMDAIGRAQRLGDEPYIWILYFTAKTFVIQSETEALVKVSSMYPYAHVITLLVQQHPLFMDILMARFAKKCPYVTPIYHVKTQDMTDDDYLKKLAYIRKEGAWEQESSYNARQSAIFSLYCAIVQTTSLQGENKYPMGHGWTWLARILNMPPRPITPNLIDVFLEVCGSVFVNTYGAQAHKVLQLLIEEFIPMIPKQAVAGKTRLKSALDRYLQNGRRFQELPERQPKRG